MSKYYVYPGFEVGSFEDSGLYQYYHNTNHLTVLDDVMQTILKKTLAYANYKITCSYNDGRGKTILNIHHLCECYDVLIKNGTDNLICDMLNTSNRYDQFAIYLVAVINERIDIIQLFMQLNFDFNQEIRLYTMFERSEPTNTIHLFESPQHNNLFTYALQNNKIDIAKYLLQNGIKIDSIGSKCLFGYINDHDDHDHDTSLFDDFYNLCQEQLNSLVLLVENINNNNHKIIERILNTEIGFDINMIKPYFKEYSLSSTKLDTFKILINYGLVIDNELFQDIFKNADMDVIDFLMSEYHFTPDNDLIMQLFQNTCLIKINLLIKHNVDLSNVMYNNQNDKYYKFANLTKRCNLDMESFVAFLLSSRCQYNMSE